MRVHRSIDASHVQATARHAHLDWGADRLHVACADGHLVTLQASTGDNLRDMVLEPDLRDVLVHGDGLLVSTFKRAELLHVDSDGVVGVRDGALPFAVNVQSKVDNDSSNGADVPFNDGVKQQPMSAHLAWRIAQNRVGEVYMLHQGESQDVVDIQTKPTDASSSPYGGGSGFGCGGIKVTPALTHVDAQGQTQTLAVQTGVLSVDMAVSPIDGRVAIAQAGQADAARAAAHGGIRWQRVRRRRVPVQGSPRSQASST